MTNFDTKPMPAARNNVAPDGSNVQILLGLEGGGMVHFKLGPDQTYRRRLVIERSKKYGRRF